MTGPVAFVLAPMAPPRRNLTLRRVAVRYVTAAPVAVTTALSPPDLAPAVALPLAACLASSSRLPPAIRDAPTAFLLSAALANLRLLPPASPLFDALVSLAPHAVALLLLAPPPPSAAPPASFRSPRTLLLPFLIGSLGTFLGSLLAAVLPPSAAAPALPALLAALAATYIGGSLNFLAVATVLSLPSHVSAAAFAIDLAAMAAYFAVLFALAAPVRVRMPPPVAPLKSDDASNGTSPTSLLRTAVPLALVSLLGLVMKGIAHALHLPAAIEPLGLSVGAIALRRSVPTHLLTGAGPTAGFALNLLFAALGATARLSAVTSAAPGVLPCAIVILAVHAAILYLIGHKICRIAREDLLLASNANIGGTATASAFAAACGWPNAIPSAIVVGTLGYVIGTPVGLLVFRMVGGLR